ncbi:MAG: peptidoglycan recognition protein family protein [Gloeomargarita sp. SKYG116]|nr:peptidoglycan recognition protein family protein [Gloeomargarita sp. SKYG116]MCS7293752.1 peptidoglycan recognition protein family protein [Gloeomargarita sp. SKYB120]MDW8179318.1 peptidoglycan recognition family protein [Gloeomargarita sp. SKYBB_i_bin120]MDW8402329.1 peptidoglycan recognition family protein [Gloeomargarita sp. SKYGB_i_bin116]
MRRWQRWLTWGVLALLFLVATQVWAWWQRPTATILISQLSPLPAGPGLCPEGLSRAKSWPQYQPPEETAFVHPSNYGQRHQLDVWGQPISYPPLIVLHETAGPADAAISLFQKDHTGRDDLQVSYHVIIRCDGTVVYLVPPEMRAYGAAPSSFRGEAVKTNPKGVFSVNNFAYHISLESPEDGYYRPPPQSQPSQTPKPDMVTTTKAAPAPSSPPPTNPLFHSGYTDAQYQSLAWLIAKTCVPWERITTHKAVDTSGSRSDPRSFDWQKFRRYLNQYPRRREIFFGFHNE